VDHFAWSRKMKILGVGLSKTGTMSLTVALRRVGFKTMHYDRARLNDVLDGSNPRPNFRRYDDVDAVTDIPSAYFYRELLEAYPEAKAILTIRDVESWWRSVSHHVNVQFPLPQHLGCAPWTQPLGSAPCTDSDAHARFMLLLHNYVYGSPTALEFLWKKKYLDHNECVVQQVPSERLLVMNITAGDGWEKLCGFLGVPVPDAPFPHLHRRVPQPAYPTAAF
jgi:hypothetical protein